MHKLYLAVYLYFNIKFMNSFFIVWVYDVAEDDTYDIPDDLVNLIPKWHVVYNYY